MSADWSEEDRTRQTKRHRGAYKPKLDDIPFELSRSAVEKYVQCNKCFWMEKVAGVKPPSIPAFLLNTNTDTLLKKDFDQYRGKEPHPIMVKAGLEHLMPEILTIAILINPGAYVFISLIAWRSRYIHRQNNKHNAKDDKTYEIFWPLHD